MVKKIFYAACLILVLVVAIGGWIYRPIAPTHPQLRMRNSFHSFLCENYTQTKMRGGVIASHLMAVNYHGWNQNGSSLRCG